MTERTCGTPVAGDGKWAVELVDSGGQVRGRYQSAKGGIRNARALEVLTFPCGRVGIGDRLRARICGTVKLFHAIVEELRGCGV